jgi:UDP-3-O-[3-hydroxymyristoyl] N-acetylglucosamine deacetylase
VTRRTIAREVHCDGVALHAGTPVRMSLAPGTPGKGIVFQRSDLGGREIPAFYAMVAETRLGTVINDGNVSVGVIEHLMAAVAGLGVDDLVVTLDGPEPPILGGDAASYVALFDEAGLRETSGVRRSLKIRKKVTAESGEAYAVLEPAESFSFDFDIHFASPAIGTQTFSWAFSTDGFRREIAAARTFGFVAELEALHKMGLAKGASLDNTLAIEGDRVINAELMRFPDEFVRHKILDALGDLALAGGPIIGKFEGHRSGHALNNQLLRAVFADPANYAWIDAG